MNAKVLVRVRDVEKRDFNKYLLNTLHMPGTMLGGGNTMIGLGQRV